MYAHIEDGNIDFQGKLPASWRNISGLSLQSGNHSFLKPLGWLPVVETNVTPDSNQVFDSDEVIINEDNVQVVHRVRSMTVEELTVRDMESWRSMRQIRNNKLASTDFYALSDVTMSSDMATYRQALRDLPATADITKWDTDNWVWPTEPE